MRTFVMLLLLVGCGLAFSACGTPTAKCTASSCSGCCDNTRQCQIGASNGACGSGGALCQPCASSQACTVGLCVTQNTSGGGGSGGGSGGGGSGGGGVVGGGSGGGGGGAGRCTPSNCSGCCDPNGACQAGASNTNCGRSGITCSQCGGSATCTLGVCLNPQVGGGAGGGGGTSCSAATCPSGCCTAAGVCITNTTPARCGGGGGRCMGCGMGGTCVSGSCQSCGGCIDINTGLCRGGTLNTQCGRNGGFCQSCDSAAGQTCQQGICSGGTTCNGSSCTGCCDGNLCRTPNQFSNAQCGQGTAGAACTTCVGTTTCDVGGTGTCVSSGADGGFGDAGLSDFCTLIGTPCTPFQCCGVDATFGLIPTCYSFGMACGTAGTICTTNNLCQ